MRNHYYSVTFNCFNRQALFKTFKINQVVICSFYHGCRMTDARLHSFVLMPDHCHLLVRLGDSSISEVVRYIKGYSVTALRKIGVAKRVWQRDFYERCIRHDEELVDCARYIIMNPVRAGLVSSVNDYPYWNSEFLCEL